MELAVFYHHIQEAARQRDLPLARMIAEAAGYGIDAAECEAPATVAEAEATRALLTENGLRCACVDVTRLDLAHGEKLGNQLDVAEAFGARKLLIVPGFLKDGDDRAAIRAQLAEGLAALCEAANARGLTVTLEDFDSAEAPYATIEQVQWLLLQVPALRCAFDTGNFLYSEENELQAFEVLGSRVAHVHCKDRTFDPSRGGDPLVTVKGRTLYPCAVGHGRIRMADVLAMLRAQGYDGTLTIEHYGSADQSADMRASAEWLREHWQTAKTR